MQLSDLPRDVLGHPKCPGVHILLPTAVSVTLNMDYVHEIHRIMSMELSVDRTQLSELPRDVLGHPKCSGVHILLSTAVSVTLYMVHVHEIHRIMSMELSVDRTQLSELPRDILRAAFYQRINTLT